MDMRKEIRVEGGGGEVTEGSPGQRDQMFAFIRVCVYQMYNLSRYQLLRYLFLNCYSVWEPTCTLWLISTIPKVTL